MILDRISSLVLTTGTSWKVTTQYFLRIVHLQLAMREHYFGLWYGIPVDSLGYVEVLRPYHGDGATTLLCVEARVCPQQENSEGSSLCLRIQQLAMIPSSCSEFASIFDTVDMKICQHLRSWDQIKLIA